MNELVPFQTKRNKHFSESITAVKAVESELSAYFVKLYGPDVVDAQLYALKFAPLTSPEMINDKSIEWSIEHVSEPLSLLIQTQNDFNEKNIKFPSRRYLFLPKTYQKMLKQILMSQETLEKLALTLKSTKKAKRTLRILHKRYGIYTEKKPKFTPS
jgi:hypothetical protein